MNNIHDTLNEQLFLEREIIGDVRYTRDRHPRKFSDLECGELFANESQSIVYIKTTLSDAFEITGNTEKFAFFPNETVWGVSVTDL